MPFALAEIAPILWAVLLLAVAIAIEAFGRFLATLIPRLPVIGNWLHNEILNAASGAGNFLISQAQGQLHVIRDLLVDMGHIDSRLWGGAVSVLEHLGSQASHLYRDVIPGAQNAAQGYAHDQVAGESSRARGAEDSINRELDHAEQVQASFSDWVKTTFHDRLEADITAAKNAATSDAEAEAQRQLDGLQADLMNRLSQVWDAIAPLQTAVYSTIPSELSAQAAKESSDIATERQDRIAQLASAVQSLNGQITALDNKQTAALAAESAAAAATSAADLSTAEGVAAADQAQAEAVAQRAIADQAAKDKAALVDAVGTLQGQIDVLQQTQTITLPALPDVTLPGTLTIPVAVGALASTIAGVITEVDNCMVSACGGPNSLENELNKLRGMFSIAGELGFLAEAIKDPVGTEHAVSSVFEGIWNTGHSLLDDLLSL